MTEPNPEQPSLPSASITPGVCRASAFGPPRSSWHAPIRAFRGGCET